MSKQRVLVTGGCGFIGSHLVDKLVDLGYLVRVFDNLSSSKLANIEGHLDSGKVEFVMGDIREPRLIRPALAGVDYVFHLAAQISVPLSVIDPSLTFDVNVSGTVHLLRLCYQIGVKKLIFSSSCAVYGDPYGLPVVEIEPNDPISPYAESKMAAEHFALGFFKTGLLKTVVLRFFNVFGPRQPLNDYSGVITKYIDNSLQGKPLLVYGEGNQTRDFICVYDVVDALVSCMKNQKANGEVFNIGSGKPTKIQYLANTIIELTKSKSKIKNKPERKGDIKYSYADISKAKNLLGFESKVNLKDGLQGLIEESSK